MAKLEKMLWNYAKRANLLIEQDPMAAPPADPLAAPPPADPMAAPGAAPVPPVAGAEGEQGAEEEGDQEEDGGAEWMQGRRRPGE